MHENLYFYFRRIPSFAPIVARTLTAWLSSSGQDVVAPLSSLIRSELLDVCDECRILCVQVSVCVQNSHESNSLRFGVLGES